MMVNTCWSTPDLLTDSMRLERNGVCLVRASVIVTMNGEPSEIWRRHWISTVCVWERKEVCTSVASVGILCRYVHACVLLCNIYSVPPCVCACGFSHV